MKLELFGKSLWKRYMADGFQKSFLFVVFLLFLTAVVDYFLRIDILWRLTVLLSSVLGVLWSVKRLIVLKPLPSEEELYYLACEINKEHTFSARPEELRLPATLLKPWAWKPYLTVMVLAICALGFQPGRLAMQRILLLSGEWPRWTTLTDIKVTQLVVQGSPVKVSFSTQGRRPKVVSIIINDQRKSLTSTGSDYWRYDFFHDPGDVTLRIEAGDDSSPMYHIKVVAFPHLTGSTITYREPDYLGGQSKTMEALTGRVPEGAQVDLSVRFKDLHTLIRPAFFNSEDHKIWRAELGEVTQDRSIMLEGKSHKNVPVSELATFRLKVIYDKVPVVTNLKPSGVAAYLPKSKIRISFKAEDDYGIAQLQLLYNNEKIVVVKNSSVLDRVIDLEALKLKPGEVLYFQPVAVDSKGQKSDSRRIKVQIVDEATFKSYLLEEHQRVHQQLEKMISSMDRRIKRHEMESLFNNSIEKSTLRSDLDRLRMLDESMGRYAERLRQIDDFEKIATQNDNDRQYITSTVPILLERLLRKDKAQLESQKTVVGKLKEISVRMAEGQDVHLIVRLIDQIISKQDRVIDKIPE